MTSAPACKSQDCEAYGNHYADAMQAPDEAHRYTVFSGAQHDCEKGRVDKVKYACVMRATREAEIFECEGLTPPPGTR